MAAASLTFQLKWAHGVPFISSVQEIECITTITKICMAFASSVLWAQDQNWIISVDAQESLEIICPNSFSFFNILNLLTQNHPQLIWEAKML